MPPLLLALLVFVAGAGLSWVVATRVLGRRAQGGPIPPPEQNGGVQLRSRILDRLPGGLIHLDMAGRILYVNDPIRDVLQERGQAMGGLEGTLLEEAFPGPHCREVREAVLEVRTKGGVRRLDTEAPIPGRWMSVEVLSSEDGVTLSIRDITERRAGEVRLRASEERYRALFEDDIAGNYVASVDGALVACNKTFARILGLPSPAEGEGLGLELFAPARDREEVVRRVREEMRIEYYEKTLRSSDGSPVHVIGSARGVFDADGGLVEIHGQITDVTDRKVLEEQLRQSQKMEAVGRLAGGVAHDFNNLLTAITGHADLLLEEAPRGSTTWDDLTQIRDAASRAGNLTGQLLAFSRRQVLRPRLVEINGVVTGVEEMLRRMIGEDVQLVTILGEGLPATRADPNQLQQALLNLAVNARDAMPQGGTLCIRTRLGGRVGPLPERGGIQNTGGPPQAEEVTDGVDGEGPGVVLEVSDTGEGIPEEIQERIFEPFFTTKEAGKGTGLGLSMVYGIVAQSGGRVEVDSAPGAGTTVRLHLPGGVSGPVDEEAPAPVLEDSQAAGGNETVLLVEDEAVVRDLAGRVLRRLGYRVIPAGGPEEALQRLGGLKAGSIHLLVTDVVMPGMTGPSLAGQVRALVPGVKVLYTSGYARESLNRNPDHIMEEPFLPKPFSPVELARAVRSALDGRGGAEGGADPRSLVS